MSNMYQHQPDILNIITITKDDFNGVCQTILSTKLLRDSYNVKQLIIDSSTSDVSEKIKLFIASEKNIDYYHTLPEGISAAFNSGIEKTSAKWLWFLNGGDAFHPKAQVNTIFDIISNSSADLILFQTEYKQQKVVPEFPPLWLIWPPFTSWIPHPSSFIQKKLFDQHGGFRLHYKSAMDFEFWLRVLSEKTVVNLISIPITLFDENGISSKQTKLSRREVRRAGFNYAFQFIKISYIRLRIFMNNLF